MKKIPCLFEREFHNNHTFTLLELVTAGCEWVIDGEGEASIKIDGTACAVIDGKLYARYDLKPGKSARKRHKDGELWNLEDFTIPPNGAIPCQEPDRVTGHYPHWVLVEDQPEYKYHREAWDNQADGTYELVGPKIQGNIYNLDRHVLYPHGEMVISPPRDFNGLCEFLRTLDGEGIVFKHPDGRMCKIRRKDFGFDWPIV